MASQNNCYLFEAEWNRNCGKILAVLQRKYKWQRGDFDDLWNDMLSEAKVLCLERFINSKESKLSFETFCIKWSQIAIKRFLEKHNKATFGDKKFETDKGDLFKLKQMVTDENNPRIILSFCIHSYLNILPENFINSGLAHKSLQELYHITKTGTINFFNQKRKPSWFESEIENIFLILWEKLGTVQSEIFSDNSTNTEKSFAKWSSEAKKNFRRNRPDNKSNRLNRFTDDGSEDTLNDFTDDCPGEDCPNKSQNFSNTPADMMLNDEKIVMSIKLLRYIVLKTEDLKYLFALLFTICRVSQKKFIKDNYHLLTLDKLAAKFEEDYLGETYLAKNSLIQVFKELEKRIKSQRNKIIFKDVNNINIADWAYKANTNILRSIIDGKDSLSKELKEYYI